MALVIDPKQLDKESSAPRTYAIQIQLLDSDSKVLSTFYKFGYAQTSVSKRFIKEPKSTRINILNIWFHTSIDEAKEHEQSLFLKYKPTLIFDGFPPCQPKNGPLFYGGNTELFLANRIDGEKNINTPSAVFWVDYSFFGHMKFTRTYLPNNYSIYSGDDYPDWLEWLNSVPYEYLFLPEESISKKRLIFVEENYLHEFQDFASSKRKRIEFQDQAIWCSTFKEAANIVFSDSTEDEI